MRYGVYGRGHDGDCTLLHDCDAIAEAVRWVQGYVRHDFGGWQQLQLVDGLAPAGSSILRVWSTEEGEQEGWPLTPPAGRARLYHVTGR